MLSIIIWNMEIKEKLDNFFLKISQFFKFCIVGLSNTLISYTVYSFLVFIDINYIFASVIAFFISMVNSFYWNNKYVFTSHGNLWIYAFLKMFITYAITGLVLHNILLFFLIDYIQVSKYIAPILILAVTIPLNFVINKYWSFKQKSQGE